MTLLEDNHAGALYNYLITVQTGHRKSAGTSANVVVTDKEQKKKLKHTLSSQNVLCTFSRTYTHWLTTSPGDGEAVRLGGREQHTQPHRPQQARVRERSRGRLPAGRALPAGRSAKPAAAARQLWRLPIVVLQAGRGHRCNSTSTLLHCTMAGGLHPTGRFTRSTGLVSGI